MTQLKEKEKKWDEDKHQIDEEFLEEEINGLEKGRIIKKKRKEKIIL